MTGSSAKNGCHYGTSTYAIANAKRAYPKRQLGSPLESDASKRHCTKIASTEKLLRSECRSQNPPIDLERKLRRKLNPARPAATEERVANTHVAGG